MVLPLSGETDLFLISVTNTKCIVCLPSPEIQLSIQDLLIAMGKPLRNECFCTVKIDLACLVGNSADSKHFLSARDNI